MQVCLSRLHRFLQVQWCCICAVCGAISDMMACPLLKGSFESHLALEDRQFGNGRQQCGGGIAAWLPLLQTCSLFI